MQRLEQLDEAANFLMLISDQVTELNRTCKINSNEALVLIQGVHSMMDKEIQEGTFAVNPEFENKCEKSCHCGLYADLTQDQKIKENLNLRAKKLSQTKLIDCAIKTSQWFCESKLLESLYLNQDPVIQNAAPGL